ncbi:hypothetical protein K488DRAFT_87030 [Vararia minispora EC-137]|uniref:Uncharacterized protein n=1 Tax=Vararia minispora EC-137 TaxID=1314806 RepID=A0ACB8QHY7_9AGAM|nr:hypothetical protein K488DRAFT_87030 [Vararia minispora EC-137]
MRDSLPLDVLDLILCSLPDLYTLSSVIKVSKCLYGVFKDRAKTIRIAVARNEVGPALLQAVRLSIVQSRLEKEDFSDRGGFEDFCDIVDQLPSEAEVDVGRALEDWDCARCISRNASFTKNIELFYSRIHQDPATTCSALSFAQSLRFTRALYRFWTYWSIYSDRWDEELNWMDDDDAYDDVLSWDEWAERLRELQRAFLLDTISDKAEKQEFCAIISFLRSELGPWISSNRNGTIHAPAYPEIYDIPLIAEFLAAHRLHEPVSPDIRLAICLCSRTQSIELAEGAYQVLDLGHVPHNLEFQREVILKDYQWG